MADESWIQYRPHHNCRDVDVFIHGPDVPDDLSCLGEDGDSQILWNLHQGGEDLEVEPGQWLYRDPVTGRITIFDEKPEEETEHA